MQNKMQNSNNGSKQATVAQQQHAARMQARIAAVQQQRAQHAAARATKHAAQQLAAQQQAFAVAVQQLAAQHGIPVAQVQLALNPNNALGARANSATGTPSNPTVMVNGVAYKPTKAVHAIAALYPTRAACIAACIAAGINPSTASTQFSVYQLAARNAAAHAAKAA